MSTLSIESSAPDLARAPVSPPPDVPVGRDTPPWLVEARAIVGDLYERSPAIYWTDFLLSIGGAWALTYVYFVAPAWSALQIFAFLAASVLFFRAGTFIHELVHFRPGQMKWFGRAWNAFMGIPLLMPWIFYRNHVDHHSARYFGTPADGEYLPLAASPVSEIVKYLAQAPLLPLFMMVRLGIVTPLSYLSPKLREFALTAATAAVSNPHYRKRFPAREERHLQIVEWLSFAYLATLAVLIAKGSITWTQVGMGYALMSWSLSLNWFRNLAAHRYGNRGERMSHVEQFYDSINIVGQTWLTVLLFPVGLRYHATHHLFPSMPYHSLGEAHRRLTERLPKDSPYHSTGRTSFFAAVGELWNGARRATRENSAMERWLRKPEAN